MNPHLHTLYAFFSINTRTLRITASAGTYIRQSRMRHLCVILSYIAQNSLLLPLNESPPCFSGSVAIRLRIFGKARPYRGLQPNTIPAAPAPTVRGHSRILLTCTGYNSAKYKYPGIGVSPIPSMYYKCRALSIFPRIKGITTRGCSRLDLNQ